MNHSTTASDTQPATGSTAARIAAGRRERSDPRLVLADRVEQLYSQLPLGIAATVVIGLISALELREGRVISSRPPPNPPSAMMRPPRSSPAEVRPMRAVPPLPGGRGPLGAARGSAA